MKQLLWHTTTITIWNRKFVIGLPYFWLFVVIIFRKAMPKGYRTFQPKTFQPPSFNLGLLNSRLFNHELFHPNSYGVEKLMVENSGVEESRVEKPCNQLEFGHFNPALPNPRLFNHEILNPILMWGWNRVSIRVVKSLWVDCRFNPTDHGSYWLICAICSFWRLSSIIMMKSVEVFPFSS